MKNLIKIFEKEGIINKSIDGLAIKRFMKFFHALDSKSQRGVFDIYYTAMSPLFYRYVRKLKHYRKKCGKKEGFTLKQVDITNMMLLADHHYRYRQDIDVQEGLFKSFRFSTEKEACSEYNKHLKNGNIRDVYGRSIVFPNYRKNFLYKDPVTGKHIIAPENYVKYRGKRLAWIKHTLETTREIYKHTERIGTTYLYLINYLLPFKNDFGEDETAMNRFLVVTRQEHKKPLEFVTAYFFKENHRSWQYVESAVPYSG